MKLISMDPNLEFTQYAASECGKLININNEAIMPGCPAKSGLTCRVRAINDKKYKTMTLQRFVCECYNGIVPNDMKIVHIDDDSLNNRLSNLHMMPKDNKEKEYDIYLK